MKSKNIGLLGIAVSMITFIASIILSILYYKYISKYIFTLLTGEEVLIAFTGLGVVVGNIFLLGLIFIISSIHWKILFTLYKNISKNVVVFNLNLNYKIIFYIGILFSFSFLLSSPVFFTKDKIYNVSLTDFKSISIEKIQNINIHAYTQVATMKRLRKCILKYDVYFSNNELIDITFGESLIYDVLAFIKSNNLSYNYSYTNYCHYDIYKEKVTSILKN